MDRKKGDVLEKNQNSNHEEDISPEMGTRATDMNLGIIMFASFGAGIFSNLTHKPLTRLYHPRVSFK